VRFRHKLSIVLIGLALVPLVAAGFLVLRLLEHDKISNVDSGLVTGITAGGQAYTAEANEASSIAAQLGAQPEVQATAAGRQHLTDAGLASLVDSLAGRTDVAAVIER